MLNLGVTVPDILLAGIMSSHVPSSSTMVMFAGFAPIYAVMARPGKPVPSKYNPGSPSFKVVDTGDSSEKKVGITRKSTGSDCTLDPNSS